MISYLAGKIVHKENSKITLLNNSGIGFEINIAENDAFEKNQDIGIYIKTIVREDDISLYGFSDIQKKQLFEKLLLVNGIGPKAALNILSGISPEALISAILNQDVTSMSKIKGLGKKSAEKIIFSLKDKFDKEKVNVVSKGIDLKENELVQSLVFLGYDQNTANKVADKIYDENKTINELIKIALIEIRR